MAGHREICNASPLLQEYLPLGRMNKLESEGFAALKSELAGSIQKGIDFVKKSSAQ